MSIKFYKCKQCCGTGEVTCDDWRCTSGGKHQCHWCNGKGKILSAKDRKRKKEIEELLSSK